MSVSMDGYELDQLIDTFRELRHVLQSNDLLDDDLVDAINGCLDILGVADVDEN